MANYFQMGKYYFSVSYIRKKNRKNYLDQEKKSSNFDQENLKLSWKMYKIVQF